MTKGYLLGPNAANYVAARMKEQGSKTGDTAAYSARISGQMMPFEITSEWEKRDEESVYSCKANQIYFDGKTYVKDEEGFEFTLYSPLDLEEEPGYAVGDLVYAIIRGNNWEIVGGPGEGVSLFIPGSCGDEPEVKEDFEKTEYLAIGKGIAGEAKILDDEDETEYTELKLDLAVSGNESQSQPKQVASSIEFTSEDESVTITVSQEESTDLMPCPPVKIDLAAEGGEESEVFMAVAIFTETRVSSETSGNGVDFATPKSPDGSLVFHELKALPIGKTLTAAQEPNEQGEWILDNPYRLNLASGDAVMLYWDKTNSRWIPVSPNKIDSVPMYVIAQVGQIPGDYFPTVVFDETIENIPIKNVEGYSTWELLAPLDVDATSWATISAPATAKNQRNQVYISDQQVILMGTLDHENQWKWEIVSEGFNGVLRGKLYDQLDYESSAEVYFDLSQDSTSGDFRITAYDGMLHEGQFIVEQSTVYIQRVTYWDSTKGFLSRWEVTGAQV